MRERPIVFSGSMVRAILNGTKTQARPILKPQPRLGLLGNGQPIGNGQLVWEPKKGKVIPFTDTCMFQVFDYCPYGTKNDRLWVRETWRPLTTHMSECVDQNDIGYRASVTDDFEDGLFDWKPSIHMPRWASRITLEITDIRVERVQSISEADAKAEGLTAFSKDGTTIKYGIPDRDGLPGGDDDGWDWSRWCIDPRNAFADRWNSINAHRGYGWDSNPWTWVLEFKRVES